MDGKIYDVTYKNHWEEWVLFMLKALEETAFRTLILTKKIVDAMRETSDIILIYQKFTQESLSMSCSPMFTQKSPA